VDADHASVLETSVEPLDHQARCSFPIVGLLMRPSPNFCSHE